MDRVTPWDENNLHFPCFFWNAWFWIEKVYIASDLELKVLQRVTFRIKHFETSQTTKKFFIQKSTFCISLLQDSDKLCIFRDS